MARCYGHSWCRCGAEKDLDGQCLQTPTGPHLKGHKAYLAPRMPEAAWLHTASIYPWRLWWQWDGPLPRIPAAVENVARETPAETNRRLCRQAAAATQAQARKRRAEDDGYADGYSTR